MALERGRFNLNDISGGLRCGAWNLTSAVLQLHAEASGLKKDNVLQVRPVYRVEPNAK